MSPALLLPVALAALAALVVPLVIHITRRSENRRLDFAALRWLAPRTQPRRRPRLDELWLLAVRLLLLTLIALWLARPVLWGISDDRPVVAVIAGADVAAARALGEGGRMVWLAPGFPDVSEAPPPPAGNVASLMRQLDAELAPAASLTVVAPEVLDDMDAERPQLSRRALWRVAVSAPQTVRRSAPPPSLTVRHSAEGEAAVRYFRAVATAWAPTGAEPRIQFATVDRALSRDTTHLVWLAAGPLPDPVVGWVRDGGVALLAHDASGPTGGEPDVTWTDSVGVPLATSAPLGRGRVVRLTRPLEPSVMPQLLEPDFPDQIERLLAPPPAPSRVAAVAHAPLFGPARYEQPPLDLRAWLALLIALVFIAERWIATRRGRGVAT